MNLVIFDTNAYKSLTSKCPKLCSGDTNIQEFVETFMNMERAANFEHSLHQLVVMELFRQFDRKEATSIRTLKMLSAFYTISERRNLLPPFEIELSSHLEEPERKTDYIRKRLHEFSHISCALNGLSIDKSPEPPQDIMRIIHKIGETMHAIKEDAKRFSKKSKTNGVHPSRSELANEFIDEYFNCLKLAIDEGLVDYELCNHPKLKAPLECLQTFAYSNVYDWLDCTSHKDTAKALKNIPNTFIDALILSSACFSCKDYPRTLVTNDDALIKERNTVNSETVQLLRFEEYLEAINYPF